MDPAIRKHLPPFEQSVELLTNLMHRFATLKQRVEGDLMDSGRLGAPVSPVVFGLY